MTTAQNQASPEAFPSDEGLDQINGSQTSSFKIFLFIALTAGLLLYNLFFLKQWDLMWMVFAVFAPVGLLIILISKILIKNSPLSNESLANVIYTILMVLAVFTTNNLQSPLLPLLLIIPLSSSFSSRYGSPLSLGLLTSILLGLGVLFFTDVRQQILTDPLKAGLIIFTPTLVGILSNKYGRQISSTEEDQEKSLKLTQKLISERMKLKEMLEGIPDGVVATNLEGDISFVNRRALEILNLPRTTFENQNIQKVFPTLDLKSKHQSGWEMALDSLDGQKIIISIVSFPVRDESGRDKGTIYIISNITSEKQFKQMKLDFVAMTAHQLRTPLTSIRNYLSIVIPTVLPKVNKEEQEFLNRSMSATNQLVSLIENLLNVSRIEDGQLKLRSNPVSLEKVILEVVGSLADFARRRSIAIYLEKSAGDIPQVMGDKYLLEEVVKNLLANAIQYTDEGGWVRVTIQAGNNQVIVHVTDNGRGISSTNLPHLFDKFYRVSQGLTMNATGIGLGLYISKSIIEAHHGQIWVDSIEGRGSDFGLSLPVATGR